MAAQNLSPQASEALRIIRALRKLPQSSATISAERQATKNLNGPDVTAVALALVEDEKGGAQ
jgi:hypothetical protein